MARRRATVSRSAPRPVCRSFPVARRRRSAGRDRLGPSSSYVIVRRRRNRIRGIDRRPSSTYEDIRAARPAGTRVKTSRPVHTPGPAGLAGRQEESEGRSGLTASSSRDTSAAAAAPGASVCCPPPTRRGRERPGIRAAIVGGGATRELGAPRP